MNHDRVITAVMVVISIILLAVAIVFWRLGHRQTEEIGRLNAEIAELAETRDGGAETDLPVVRETSGDWTFPIAESDYIYTSPYGYRISPILKVERYHTGLDIGSTWHAQVVAIADGVVVDEPVIFPDGISISGGHYPPPGTAMRGHPGVVYRGHDIYGGLVVLQHENGWYSLYAHLSATYVHMGDIVRAGSVIGRVGNTGQSNGAHLHIEIRDALGRSLNPLLYISPGLPESD